MKDHVFHSLLMAAGAAATNFKVEILSQDPVVTEAGRVWFTGGALKFSYLDAQSALQVAIVATGSGLVDAIANLNAALAAETTRAEAAETTLTTGLAAANTAIADEIARATAAEGTATAAITAEVARAEGVEAGLQTQINTLGTQKADVSYVDGKISGLGNAFQYVGTVAGGADQASAVDLSALTSPKTAGSYYRVAAGAAGQWFKVGAGAAFQANPNDGLLFNTDGGVDRIDATDANVNGSQYVEVTGDESVGFTISFTQAALDRLTAIEASVTAEAARATAAEGTLTTNLAAEVTRATGAETTLQANIDAAAAASNTRFEALGTHLNSRVQIYTATDDAQTHTLTHNLGHTNALLAIHQIDTDGTLVNSYVPYDFNNTTLVAYLSSPGKVKIVLQDVSDITA